MLSLHWIDRNVWFIYICINKMCLIFRPRLRADLLINEVMPKGWAQMRISALIVSLKKEDRWHPRRTPISSWLNAESLLGTTSRSAFGNVISQRYRELVMSTREPKICFRTSSLHISPYRPWIQTKRLKPWRTKSSILLLRRWLHNSISTRWDYTISLSKIRKLQNLLAH